MFVALCSVAAACGGGGDSDGAGYDERPMGYDGEYAPTSAPVPAPTLAPVPTPILSPTVAAAEPVGALLAVAADGGSVWSGSADGVRVGDVGLRNADVYDDEVGIEGVSADVWDEAVYMAGRGYEIGWAGGDPGGELDVSLPVATREVSPGDTAFVWFSSPDGTAEYAPGLYHPWNGTVTAAVPARLLGGTRPADEFWSGVKMMPGVVRSSVEHTPVGYSTVVPGGASLVWDGAAWTAVRGAEIAVGGGVYAWDGDGWFAAGTGEALARGTDLVIAGKSHVWSGSMWVPAVLAALLDAGWVAPALKVKGTMDSRADGTSPQCSGTELVEDGAPTLGPPEWAEVSKHQLSAVHVCKYPGGDDKVGISLKSNRRGAVLVQVPDNAEDLNVDHQPNEWTRQALADVASLRHYPGDWPQPGRTPILLLGGTQMDYTLQRPDQHEASETVAPAAHHTATLAAFNALTAAIPALWDAAAEIAALYALGGECWDGLHWHGSIPVGPLVDCLVGVYDHYYSPDPPWEEPWADPDRAKDKFLEKTGRSIDSRAVDHIHENRGHLIQTVRKLKSIQTAVANAGGWAATMGGPIPWEWDTYRDRDDDRSLNYTLKPKSQRRQQPDNNTDIGGMSEPADGAVLPTP